jgi:hypothetical protein
MKRNGMWLLGAAALALSTPALSQPTAATTSPAPVQRQGTLTVTGAYLVNKAIPNGTQVSVSVYTSVSDLVYSNSNQVSPMAKVDNGKVTFKVSLPYAWLVKSTTDRATVTVQISASYSGNVVSYYYSNNDTRMIAIPKNGATTAVPFNGSL